MKMKTLLLSIVAVLALGSAANATDFTCSQTQFLVGQQSRDAQDKLPGLKFATLRITGKSIIGLATAW